MRETRITYQECLDIARYDFEKSSTLDEQSRVFGYSVPTLRKLRREPRYIEAMEALKANALETLLERTD